MMNKIILWAVLLLPANIMGNLNKHVPLNDNDPYFKLVHFCLKDYPTNTQVSIALINDSMVTFLGYKKLGDSIYSVENKDSVYLLASVSKIFTSCIFSDLVYHHVFYLEEPIEGILPFSLKQYEYGGQQITFKTLLNHTSGLPWDPSNNEEWDANDPFATYSKERFDDYLHNQVTLYRTPGDTFQYSNTGMALLGYLMEQKTGKTYEELLQERVFKKYGMNSTSSDPTKIKNHIIQGINSVGYPIPLSHLNALAPAGGVLSNVNDLQKFVRANFTNDTILSFLRQITYQINGFRIALGWFMFQFGSIGLPGGYSHEGGAVGYRTNMIVDITDKLGVVVLSNVSVYHPQTNRITILGYELLKRLYIAQKLSLPEYPHAPFIELALQRGWGSNLNDSIIRISKNLNSIVGVWQKESEGRTITRTFMPNNKVQCDFMNNDEIDVWGYYHLKDSTKSINDAGGAACEYDGSYKYNLANDTLSFKVIKDSCSGRLNNIAGNWVRKKN